MRYITYIPILVILFACNSQKEIKQQTNSTDPTISILEVERTPSKQLEKLSSVSESAELFLYKAFCWSSLNNVDSAYYHLQKSWSFSYNQYDSLLADIVQSYVLLQKKSFKASIEYLENVDVSNRDVVNKAYFYRLLSKSYLKAGDFNTALKSINKGLAALSNIDDAEELLLDMELMQVELLIEKGDLSNAISILDQLKNGSDVSSYLFLSVKSDILLARIHAFMGNDEHAFKYLFPSLTLSKNLKSQLLLVEVYTEIASIFSNEGNSEKALEYLNYGLDEIGECKEHNLCGNLYLQLGHVFLKKGENANALTYFKKALEQFNKRNDMLKKAWSYYSIGKVYLAEEAYTEARKHFMLADYIRNESHLSETTSYIDLEINTLYYFAKLNVVEGNNKQANRFYEKAYKLAKSEGLDKLQVLILGELSVFSESLGNEKDALAYYREQERLKHKIEQEKNLYMVAAVEHEYLSLQNRQKIEMQESTLRLQTEQLQKIKALSVILSIISVICIVALIIARNFKEKRKEALKILEEKNRALESKTKELQSINGFKDQLISVIGHDLRSPIGMLKTSLDFFVESADELPKKDILRFMKSFKPNVSQTYSMLNNLLVWAQSQQGRLTIHKQSITIGELMTDELSILREQSGRKNINLNVFWNDELNVFCDKPTISTALRNIISNAVKFTPEGGEVRLNANYTEKKSCIEITDSGIGMEDRLIKKILNGEKIVSEKGTNNERGTGLGLVICKDFIVKNGGEMKIKSKKGEGTTISVILPSLN